VEKFHEHIIRFVAEKYDLNVAGHWRNFEVGKYAIEIVGIEFLIVAIFQSKQSGERY